MNNMKLVFSFLFLLSICLIQAQDNTSTISKDQQLFDAQAKEYMKYKKYMYIDYMPKTKIPDGLKKNFYSDLTPSSYAQGIGQQMDTINKVHRLFITTAKAGKGFLDVNKGALAKVPSIEDVTEIVYIVDQDSVKNFKQMSDLVTLTSANLKKVDYKITPDNKLIISIASQK